MPSAFPTVGDLQSLGLTGPHAVRTLQVLDACYKPQAGLHPSHSAARALEAVELYWQKEASEAPMTFGVEGLCYEPDVARTDSLEYLNTGQTYDLTLLFCSQERRFLVASWGAVIEEREVIT